MLPAGHPYHSLPSSASPLHFMPCPPRLATGPRPRCSGQGRRELLPAPPRQPAGAGRADGGVRPRHVVHLLLPVPWLASALEPPGPAPHSLRAGERSSTPQGPTQQPALGLLAAMPARAARHARNKPAAMPRSTRPAPSSAAAGGRERVPPGDGGPGVAGAAQHAACACWHRPVSICAAKASAQASPGPIHY